MRYILVFLISICIGNAQDIHTPAQILEILGDSKISYNLKELNEDIPCHYYPKRILDNSVFRSVNDKGQLEVKPYGDLSGKGQYHYDKAEEQFTAANTDSAQYHYKKLLEYDPQYYKAMTYIGQLYGIKKEYDKAIEWYLRVIDSNYIDYLAHWFLADAYLRQDRIEEAIDEITIANILNRNNPKIKDVQFMAYGIGDYSINDWCFGPQYKFEEVGENKIDLYYKKTWLMYAMAKALWRYEPGYHASMGVAEGQYTSKEEFECLTAMLTGLQNSNPDYRNIRELQILYKAYDSNTMNEFIFYEIILPQFPHVVYQLPKEKIEALKDYVLNVRQKK